ncbi:MAG: HAD family hydrolase [Anaerolineales bacterium]|jgi:HAD superfamily hydrolase (TIGR01509 family)
MRIQAIIFDFDGLIVDTETPTYQVWKEAFERYALELPLTVWSDCIGKGDEDNPLRYLEESIGELVDREKFVAAIDVRRVDRVSDAPPLPGVVETIRAAHERGYRLAIASSSPHGWVDPQLDRLGVTQFFESILCEEDVAETKPSPELFLLTLDRLQIMPEEAIVLEDSPNGVTAAKRANLFTIVVPNLITKQLDVDGADMRLESLADLTFDDLMTEVESR